MKYLSRLIAICTLVSSLFYPVHADVVKPALVEISVFTTEVVEVEIRSSREALLTGINGKYRNTKKLQIRMSMITIAKWKRLNFARLLKPLCQLY